MFRPTGVGSVSLHPLKMHFEVILSRARKVYFRVIGAVIKDASSLLPLPWLPARSGARSSESHICQNQADTPNFLYAAPERAACAPFFKERRMKFREPTKLRRKSGIWGTRHLLEGERGWKVRYGRK